MNILGVEEKLRKNKGNIETIDSKLARILIPHDSERWGRGDFALFSLVFTSNVNGSNFMQDCIEHLEYKIVSTIS